MKCCLLTFDKNVFVWFEFTRVTTLLKEIQDLKCLVYIPTSWHFLYMYYMKEYKVHWKSTIHVRLCWHVGMQSTAHSHIATDAKNILFSWKEIGHRCMNEVLKYLCIYRNTRVNWNSPPPREMLTWLCKRHVLCLRRCVLTYLKAFRYVRRH